MATPHKLSEWYGIVGFDLPDGETRVLKAKNFKVDTKINDVNKELADVAVVIKSLQMTRSKKYYEDVEQMKREVVDKDKVYDDDWVIGKLKNDIISGDINLVPGNNRIRYRVVRIAFAGGRESHLTEVIYLSTIHGDSRIIPQSVVADKAME